MSREHSMIEIADDFDLWGEYVDPNATMSEEEFNALTTAQKVEMQREMFPYEAAEEDAAGESAE